MISLKPSSSSPSRFSSGTNTSSKAISAVSEACQPSLSSLMALTPGSPRSTSRNEMPVVAALAASSCTAVTMKSRAHAVGDERLRAVDHPAAVDALGARAQRGHVGAGVGLGDAQRADRLAGDRRHQVALLLLVGAELPDRRRGDAGVRAEPAASPPEPQRASSSAEHGVVQVVAALAAELGRVLQPEAARASASSREHLVGEPARLLPLPSHAARSSAADEAADRRAQVLVLGGEQVGQAVGASAQGYPLLSVRLPFGLAPVYVYWILRNW